ncbi:hypothetical protein HZS_5110 [Henneguya salminicola]|nr:hypothetical protein HZS_5110 [Henneguya salminicola]
MNKKTESFYDSRTKSQVREKVRQYRNEIEIVLCSVAARRDFYRYYVQNFPTRIKQCLLVMGYDSSTCLTIPCIWCLMTVKRETLYWIGLIKAVKAQISSSRVLGCFFFTLSRRLSHLLLKKLYDFPTIIDRAAVARAADFLESIIPPKTTSWICFFNYFRSTRYPVEIGNVYGEENDMIGEPTTRLSVIIVLLMNNFLHLPQQWHSSVKSLEIKKRHLHSRSDECVRTSFRVQKERKLFSPLSTTNLFYL